MSFQKHGSKFLKGLRSFRVAPRITTLAIESYLCSLDHPRALTVWLLYKNQEHDQLANLEFDPMSYNSLSDIRDSYAATNFLVKFKGLSLNYDLDKVAYEKFEKFEQLCKETNSRFRNLSLDPLFHGPNVWLHNATIRKIDKILGEFDVHEFFSLPDWGPGASTLIKRRLASPQEKFQSETGITRDLYSLLFRVAIPRPCSLFEVSYPHWAAHLEQGSVFPNFQVHSKVITVPKDARGNRVIAIEPGINLWFQKSLGNMIVQRLNRVGIDLTDQSRNQHLAKLGSLTGELATIDFSSASDSIASAVVQALLPPRWLSLLETCRTHYGQVEGVTRKWEKFSSMGNGFTFPLQSLIFFAAAKSCVEYLELSTQTVSVFGDDVILPTSAFNLFSELMRFYGFRVNPRKSFYTSPFRESCGAHFYSGFDTKPIYLKDKLTSVLTVYRLANAVRRLASSRMCNLGCGWRFKTTVDHLVRSVPVALRLRIPDGFGDGGFISNLDEATPSRASHGIEGYLVTHATDMGCTHEDVRPGYLFAELWRLSKRERGLLPLEKRPSMLQAITWANGLASHELPGRNTTSTHDTRIGLSKSIVRQWVSLGPWI